MNEPMNIIVDPTALLQSIAAAAVALQEKDIPPAAFVLLRDMEHDIATLEEDIDDGYYDN